MKIPFVDLRAQHAKYREEFDAAVSAVIAEAAFIGGNAVKTFEKKFADEYGVRHCISCGNGTDAIYIALRMLDIGPGDEVITTAASWISTSEAISQTGAVPIFVDVDEYFHIDVTKVAGKITPRTRAIVPVHLYGQPADMKVLRALAEKHGLHLVEDCAQAHFAEFGGARVGTFGAAGTFSFFPGKNLGAWGDAGAIITNDDDLARSMRMFANHGALIKHQHEMEGINSRLDGIQAALLSAKLPHIHEWTDARRDIAIQYRQLLAGVGDLIMPLERADARHVYHLFVVRTKYRDALRISLAEKGIETGVHYPTALPLLSAYDSRSFTLADFPVAARNQGEILSLPIWPEMTAEMLAYVANAIGEFFAEKTHIGTAHGVVTA